MLFEIFVNIPSLVMAEIAWLVRFALALTCLLVLFAVAIGAVGLRWRRELVHAQAQCRYAARRPSEADIGSSAH